MGRSRIGDKERAMTKKWQGMVRLAESYKDAIYNPNTRWFSTTTKRAMSHALDLIEQEIAAIEKAMDALGIPT